MANSDGSVLIDTELDLSGLKKGLAKMAGAVSSGIGTALKAAATGLAGLGTYAVKVGSDFEAAISNVAATMGKTADEIPEITAKAKELGASTAFSASEAAEGFNILAQSGLSAAEQLSTIDSVLSLAAAGEMSMADAAGYVTTTMKAMGIAMDEEGKNAAYVSDLYAKGATLANTSTAEFGEAMTSAASIAGSYNQSLETTGTALLALAEKGYKGSAAGTYLSRAMSDLYAPTVNASAALQELGVSAYDSEGKQRDFIDVLNDLNDALADMTDEEAAAYTAQIFTTAGLKAFNSIAQNSSEDLAALTGNLTDCTDAAKQMAETKLDNLQGDITKLKSATEGFGINLYENMQAPLRDFVQEGTSLVDELNKAVQTDGLAGLAGAVGDALSKAVTKIVEYVPVFVSGAANLVSSLVQGLTSNATVLAETASGLAGTLINAFLSIAADLTKLAGELIIALCGGLSANAGKITQAIANGLGTLVTTVAEYLPEIFHAGVQLLTSLISGMLDSIPSLVDVAAEIALTLVDGLLSSAGLLLNCVAQIVQQLAASLPTAVQRIVSILPQIIDSLVIGLMSFIPEVISCGVELLSSLAQAIPQAIEAILPQLPEIVSSIVGALLELIPFIVDCGVELLVSLVQALPDIIYQITLVLPQIIAGIVASLIACVPQLIECGIELLTSLIAALPDIIITIVAVLPSIVMAIVSALIDNIPLIIQCGIDLLTSLISALPEIITAIVAAMPTIIISIVNTLVSNAGMIVQAGVQLLTSLITALPDIISTIVRALPQILHSIVSTLMGFIPSMVDTGRNLLLGLGDGIKQAVNNVIGSVVDAAQRILGSIKRFFGIASPSKLFKNEIGKNLMLGLADGIAASASAAVAAAQSVAGDIADVDFEIPPPSVGKDDPDYDALAVRAVGAVRATHADTAQVVSAGTASKSYSTKGNSEANSKDANTPKCVKTQINIEGKPFARVITPYVAEELDWEG